MSTTDLPGSSLLAGRYRLVERLGAGGMSVVWRGFDEVLGRQVAVKVLPPSTSVDPAFRRRLRAEAQAAARLSHPNITNVYDYGEATTVDGEPVPYVVMELIDGESLAAVLARTRRLPWQHAVGITAEVAAALAAAHARGIVHRDVTPANVMLTQTGAKVVDFGISALIGENDIDPDGSLLGTPAYLAPERLEGGQVSPATDVYAVGLLIYRTLIGQLPWDVGTTTALLRAHQYVEPDPLPPVDGLPPAVDALVGRCLEKHPADRPSSAELAHVLAQIAAGAPMVASGYVPDWARNAEDTTILPAQRSYPDVIRREPAPMQQEMAVPPARHSRFGDLPSGPVVMSAPLRPAVGDESTAGVKGNKSAKEKTRRILVAAGFVLLLGAGTYSWSLVSNLNPNAGAGGTPQPSVVPATGKCVVSYAVWSDANGQFKAQVTLANRDDVPVDNWKLWFIMPGDQTVTGGGKSVLTQADRAITVTSSAPLNPQTTLNVPITGQYVQSNTPPLAFMLNNRTCETFVSAKPGEPSRQVEHLSNGHVRLGPTASASTTPVPGISIDPSGIVHITPTTAPVTTAPVATTGPTATEATTVPTTGTTSTQTPIFPTPKSSEASPTPTPTATTTDPIVQPTTSPASPPPTATLDCDPDAPGGC
ncbi:protein kinase [Actinoplanes sp. KI2]|uniref:serine/threonine-protein kinase n=1 Tax=Actinoplanes sp. KI2 TaxID=2983315 RepID=UPI0021D5C674|nr:serine/threonine-protein kinase [Actinoplanes sp. KI2]MCU7724811.1 protein kinase [Actinoplanes sp. KI2]